VKRAREAKNDRGLPPDAVPLTIARPLDDEGEERQKPLQFALISRLFSWTRPYARKRNTLFFLVICRSIQLPALAWMIAAIIGGPIKAGDPAAIAWAVAGFAAFATVTEFMFHFRQRLALELGEAVVHDLRNAIFTHVMNMPMSFFNRTKLGRIISRVTSDVEILRQGVQNVLFVSMVQIGQMLVAGALMLYADWVLFSIILGLVPIVWILNRYFRNRMSEATRAVQESFSRVTSNLAESVNGIRVTQGFVRQEVNAHFFRGLVQDHSAYNMDMARTSGKFVPLLELNSQIFIAILLLGGGIRVLSPDRNMDVADMIQFFFLANIFFAPVTSLAQQYHHALLAMAGAERVFRLLDTRPDWSDDADAEEIATVRGEVEFRDVGFCYDTGRSVLEEISFTVSPGQTVALVGHTGSGKSTIANLLTKFYLPSAGEIFIDGREIRTISGESLHRRMGIVQQNNFLFSGTVLDNIRFSRPDATREEVEDAIRRLDCMDMIEALPNGLDTVVGEKGSGISLGQRQLICFARAMIADPSILIFDEATSAIDAITEDRLQRALSSLLDGRTSFLIAHRLSTIRNADLVLVLRNGRIVERGNHESLLAENGYYAELYRQFMKTGAEA
jgi:ATP-binding cassette, subfamily B, bacterial